MKSRLLVCFFCLIVAPVLTASPASVQGEGEVLAIRAGRMIDGTGAPAVENVVVIVRGDTIDVVGSEGEVEIPAGARVIDLGEQTLLPGLIDAHAHVSVRVDSGGIQAELAGMAQPGAEQMARVPRNLRLQLLSGVTTAYVVGETQNIDVYTKQAVERGLFPGPRIYPGGLWISTTAGLGPPESLVFDGPWDFRRIIRQQVENGAHHVKLMVTNAIRIGPNAGHDFRSETSNFTREEIEAAVDEAHRLGVEVTAHASGAAARLALDAGVDSIQHAGGLDDELIDAFLRRDAGLVNTFVIDFGIFFDDEWDWVDSEATSIVDWLLRSRSVVREARLTIPARDSQVRARWRELAHAKDRGVLVVVGTDNIQGVLPLEIANLVDAGFSPLEAISAATGIAARVVGIDSEVGTIEKGKFADLIAVDGRPDENIEDLFGPVFIMVGGTDFSRLSFR